MKTTYQGTKPFLDNDGPIPVQLLAVSYLVFNKVTSTYESHLAHLVNRVSTLCDLEQCHLLTVGIVDELDRPAGSPSQWPIEGAVSV
jgi:hypothetical protein